MCICPFISECYNYFFLRLIYKFLEEPQAFFGNGNCLRQDLSGLGGVDQAVECLPSGHKALSSKSSTAKKKKKKERIYPKSSYMLLTNTYGIYYFLILNVLLTLLAFKFYLHC
jgi:hypothetical protein